MQHIAKPNDPDSGFPRCHIQIPCALAPLLAGGWAGSPVFQPKFNYIYRRSLMKNNRTLEIAA